MSETKKRKLDELPREAAKFVEFIRIRTVHPDPDYKSCRTWLLGYLKEIGLEVVIDKEFVPGKPLLVAKLPGARPELPAILLNSHVDVVPVEQDKWIVDAFSGHVTEEGRVYGRGSQDMKCVGVQHLEAVRRIKETGDVLERTVYLSMVPDEEVGGGDGMETFVESPEFRSLDIGLCLDEGLARETEEMTVFYGERHIYWCTVTLSGNPGHGSRFIENTAAEKMRKLLNKALDYREKQRQKLLENSSCMTLGEVTTINVTMVNGGIAPNVVPSQFNVTLDCRVSHEHAFSDFRALLQSWVDESGGGDITTLHQSCNDSLSTISQEDPWWGALIGAARKHSITLVPEIFPAGTDSRYLRAQGIPAYGFSPINNTPILLHDHNEWLGVETFMKGIEIFEDVIRGVSNTLHSNGC